MEGEAAPVEAAPVEAAKDAAPVEAKAPPKPRTIDDDLEDVLKRHGGLKYKAGGKEKSITAAKDLTRYLSRVDGTEAAAPEASDEDDEELAEGEDDEVVDLDDDLAEDPGRNALLRDLFGEGSPDAA